MIKIIRGVYGHYVTDQNGRTRVVARDRRSEPIELTPEQEARLVSQGVARYVDSTETGAAPIGFDEQPPEDEGAADIARAEAEKPMEEMTIKELRELGREQYGISFKVGMTKAEMIAAMREKWPEEPETEASEPAPTFDAAEAVQ
nr:MAG TPA: HeH/LEM domain [Caudoviricetes sp.]